MSSPMAKVSNLTSNDANQSPAPTNSSSRSSRLSTRSIYLNAVNAFKATIFASTSFTSTESTSNCDNQPKFPIIQEQSKHSTKSVPESDDGKRTQTTSDDTDESWASSSEGETTEPLPGSFWRPSRHYGNDDTDSIEDNTDVPTSSESTTSRVFLNKVPRKKHRRRRKVSSSSGHKHVTIHSSIERNQRRSQARLLLVSLLENFCMLYSPEDNRLLFQILCEKLSAMGIITEDDYLDQFSAVRGVYKRAFKELVFQALMVTRASREGRPILKSSNSLLIEPGPSSPGSDVDIHPNNVSITDYTDNRIPSSTTDNVKAASLTHVSQLSINTTQSIRTVKSSPHVSAVTVSEIADLLDLHTTRYRTDFDELRQLGKGGYGSVWHVRHRLDGREYAIKKVTLSIPKDFDRVLREVKVLARMDHPNIVRYHSAWLEHDEVSLTWSGKKRDGTFSGESTDNSCTFPSDSSPSVSSNETECDHVVFKTDAERRTSNSITSSEMTNSCYMSSDHHVMQQFPKPPYRPLTLFIQMELCYSSLHDYLLVRNTSQHLDAKVLVTECNFLFQAVLIALEYIHERGTSHRDLTPRNLFLARKPGRPRTRYSISNGSRSPVVVEDERRLPLCEWLKVESLDDISIKIGDFGLVTEHANRGDSSIFSSPQSPSASSRPPWLSHFVTSPENGLKPRAIKEPGVASPLIASHVIDEVDNLVINNIVNPVSVMPSFPHKPAIQRLFPNGVPQRAVSPLAPMSPVLRSVSPVVPTVGRLSPIIPPRRLSLNMRRLPTHAPTLGVGTATYSAPEQIASHGSSKYRWHPITSDMWSLGLILLELLYPFTTGMERLIALERLRALNTVDRTLPEDIITRFPQYAAMILWLTAEDPAQRPTPSELLAVFPPPVPETMSSSNSPHGNNNNRTNGASRSGRNSRRGSNSSGLSNNNSKHMVSPTWNTFHHHYLHNTTDPTDNQEDLGQIVQLKRVIDEQHAQLAIKDQEIDRLRARLVELELSIGPPLTPPRLSSPDLT